MPDVVYSVAVEYMQSGNLSLPTGIKQQADSLGKISDHFSHISHAAAGFNSVLDNIAGSMLRLGVGAATSATTVLAGGFAAAVHEAFKFNEQMELVTLGLANIANATGSISANGEGSPLSRAFRLSGDVVTQMRKDARDLPGEFKDLQNIMAQIEPAAGNAGIGMFGTEKMAAQTMTAAAMLNVPMQVAGREMGMMLSGSARHSMPMFTKLGFTDSAAFNKMSQGDRTAAIRQKLEALNSEEALKRVKGTWEVIKSTALDTFRQSVAIVGGPLFQRVKEFVNQFNHLGDTNPGLKDHLIDMGVKLGDALVRAFDRSIEFIKKWQGPVMEFIGTMERGFQRVFAGIGPLLEKVSSHLEAFLTDPAAFTKLEHIVGMFAAARIGGAAVEEGAGLLGGVAKIGGGLAQMGGGGAAGLAEVAAVAWPLAAALAVVAVGAAGAAHAIADTSSQFHGLATHEMSSIGSSLAKAGAELDKLWVSVAPLVDILGVVFLGYVNMTIDAFVLLVETINGLISASASFAHWVGDKTGLTTLNKDKQGAGMETDAATRQEAVLGHLIALNAPAEAGELGAKKPPVHNTTIHKVEIKVDGNADPSRVAKMTVSMLQNLARNPTQSRGGPTNFTSGF